MRELSSRGYLVDDGWDEVDLAAAEERLGVPPPVALQDAYRLFSRRYDLTSISNILLILVHLYLDDKKEVGVFQVEN